MKKITIASVALLGLAVALVPLSAATASPADGIITVGGIDWRFQSQPFGVSDVARPSDSNMDAYDDTELSLSVDGGSNWTEVTCVDKYANDWLNTTPISGGGQAVSCRSTIDTGISLSVDPVIVIAADGLSATSTYVITNTSGSSQNYLWKFHHNYGNPQINGATFSSVFSLDNGVSSDASPAATAWGPTSSACAPTSGVNDGADDMIVTSSACALAGGASTALSFVHLIDAGGNYGDLSTTATAAFVTDDSALAAHIPAGVVAANWNLTGTLTVPNVRQSMTLTGTAALGSNLTVSFNAGEVPYGDYFDIWMCPNQNTLPIDTIDTTYGDCVPVTWWNRSLVTGYDQATSAMTMTWQLSNDSTPGLLSDGGASYLDGSAAPIMIDPPTGDGGWCQYAGWYIVVNDFPDAEVTQGVHSNFSDALSATGCPNAGGDGGSGGSGGSGAGGSEAASLANTGSNDGLSLLIGVLALIAGLGTVVAVRRRSA